MSPVRPESSQDAAPIGAPQSTVSRVGAVVVIGLALAGAAWLLTELTGFEYGLDQGIYGAVADVMHAGGVPYRDAWDFKPPGVFFAYSLARSLFGEGMAAIRIFEALGFASLVLAFAIFSRRFTGSAGPGLLGGALAVSGHVWLGFWHTAQPESFGAVLLAWALVLATAPAGPGSSRAALPRELAWAGAGALYMLAALLKPPLGGGLVVSWLFVLRAVRREASPEQRALAWLRPSLAFAAGAAAPLLLVILGTVALERGSLGNSIAIGFVTLAVFGLALSAPLAILIVWPWAAGQVDRLFRMAARTRMVTGSILLLLGLWSIYFGLRA